MINVLMIEDDSELAEIISEHLDRYNIKVTNYETPDLGISGLRLKKFDLVILDLSLPDIDGIEVCKIIRERSDIPIIISSARSDITDKASCFSAGADDYMPKPYDSQELVFRINSILRRYKPKEEKEREPANKTFTLDEDKMEIRKNGELIHLTNGEFHVLSYLIKKNGFVLSREEILTNAEYINYESTLKSIDVIISRIRYKIEEDPKNPKYIVSIRGIGYKLVEQ